MSPGTGRYVAVRDQPKPLIDVTESTQGTGYLLVQVKGIASKVYSSRHRFSLYKV